MCIYIYIYIYTHTLVDMNLNVNICINFNFELIHTLILFELDNMDMHTKQLLVRRCQCKLLLYYIVFRSYD